MLGSIAQKIFIHGRMMLENYSLILDWRRFAQTPPGAAASYAPCAPCADGMFDL
jgi:hypothetical protein